MQIPSTYLLHLKTMNKFGIWTGGADDKKMDSVKATSIVGGMRFWADALLRAEGQHCCTEQGRCNPDETCPTCQIFGHTGLSRAFNVSVSAEKFSPCEKGTLKITLNDVPGGRSEHPSYFLTQGYTGRLELGLAMRRPHEGAYALPPAALTALYLMLEYGTLGAYDQYGCGLVSMKKDEEEELRGLCADYQPSGSEAAKGALTFRDFFFFKGKVNDTDTARAMCRIRYDMRNKIRGPHEDRIRHEFCGCLGRNGEQSMGTDYTLSLSQNGILYGWGHFSRSMDNEETRNRIVSALFNIIMAKCATDFAWREFGSAQRDPASARKDWTTYLHDLISTPWRTL
ncbi:MAG: type III-B CRISPR module RAMP protein Cmr1 [Deltaproteobacteria bacterium]|nr:type III-B CRISPR module RAMP protein Cmr1 [Deltaproteobacteria bacterium]